MFLLTKLKPVVLQRTIQRFFETYGHKLLIDEFQRVPSILLEIKNIVDNAKYNNEDSEGMFWLTGSQRFKMMKNISETLAGRVAVFTMLPLSQREIEGTESTPFIPDIDILKTKSYERKTLREILMQYSVEVCLKLLQPQR